MSRMSTAPRPPVPAAAAALFAAEALFAEARRRRRRRRLTGLVVTLALATAAAVGFTVARPHGAAVVRDADGRRQAAVITAGATHEYVAWVDYRRRLHIGDLATGAQRVVGRSTADPALSLVQAGGHLYWTDYWAGLAGKRVVVQELNPATGKVRSMGPGQSVFTSAGGRHVFLARTDTKVIELSARGSGAKHELTPPRGWHLPIWGSIGVGRGILVEARRGQATRPHTVTAVWNPGTGALKAIGRDIEVMAAYTPPGARYSLLAWEPSRCTLGQNCPLHITNTATSSTKTLRSPVHHGFAVGGAAFSPDGKQLAVFASGSSDGTGAVHLGMVNTATGTLRLAGSIPLTVGCGAGWTLWLPDGRHLITGASKASYAVNAATLSARPLSFTHSRGQYIGTSQDINYSAVLLPPRR
jgi:hypothetical protein